MGTGPRIAELLIRILVPAAAGLALVSIVTGRDLGVDSDLHVIAAADVARGEHLPIRAHVYTALRRPQGAELDPQPVAVALRTPTGALITQTTLGPSFADTRDGVLELPADFEGHALLKARTTSGEPTAIELPVDVRAQAPPPLQPEPRPLRALQQLSAGPLHALERERPAPRSLELRVAGGACVPEEPCELWVHVGEPAASLRVEPTPSVTPHAAASSPSGPSAWALPLRVVTHGAEAELELRAERDGVDVARRKFRLPIAQASHALPPTPPLWRAPALLELGLPALATSGERGCIVDAFRDGRWRATGALPRCHGDEPLPFAALGPGLWRLQVRRDPFASNSAAVRSLYVQRSGESEREAVAALVAAVRARFPDDPLARALTGDALQALPQVELVPVASYLLAALDDGILALPAPASSYPRALLALQKTRARVRTLALLVLLLGAVTLGLLLARRGLRAASEAGYIMSEAGETPARLDRQRVRRVTLVLATVSSLLLAFAAIAMYIIARGHAP